MLPDDFRRRQYAHERQNRSQTHDFSQCGDEHERDDENYLSAAMSTEMTPEPQQQCKVGSVGWRGNHCMSLRLRKTSRPSADRQPTKNPRAVPDRTKSVRLGLCRIS